MDEQNPYSAPESRIADTVRAAQDADLADRGERLAAAIIDTVIALAVLVPVMFLGGYFETMMQTAMTGEKPSLATNLLWSGIGLLLFFVVQGYPLYATAQTWGKRVMKLQIVGLDGARAPFGRLIALRYLPMQGVSALPFVGPLLSIVNVLLIFRDDRRCGHDLIAGTRVVKLR
ncbi:MAG: RDD family protein [Pseudomonadota bacterium]